MHPHIPVRVEITVAVVVVVLAFVAVVVPAIGDRVHYGPRRPWLSLSRRVAWRLHPGPGWAGRWSFQHEHGLPLARSVARHARPGLTWAGRRFGAPWRYAVYIGRGMGWFCRPKMWTHLNCLLLVIGGPQEGKSQYAAARVVDAPGAVLAVSIRDDLARATVPLRAERGTVHILNPEDVGGAAGFRSTLRVNLVAGCEDIAVAIRRAGAMVDGQPLGGLKDEGFWNAQSSQLLAAWMHAAALGGVQLPELHRWLGNHEVPLRILRGHPGAAESAVDEAALYATYPGRTRAGIQMTLSNTLGFLAVPAIAAATVTADGGVGFDFDEFVRGGRDTLYLISADTDATPVTGLLMAVCAELAHVVRMAGSVPRPGRPPRGPVAGLAWLGRLLDRLDPPRATTRNDPPVRLVADEFSNIAPLPVDRWASWAAGSGFQLIVLCQAWAQVILRYGRDGANVIWQCCRTRIVWGGTAEPDLAELVEKGCGITRVRTVDRDPDTWAQPGADGSGGGRQHGRRRWRSEDMPLITTAGLRRLPAGCAVVLSDHGRAAIVEVEQARHRRDVVKAARAAAWEPAPAAAVPDPAGGVPSAGRGGADAGPVPAAPEVPAPRTWPDAGGADVWAPSPGGHDHPAPPRTAPPSPGRPAPWAARGRKPENEPEDD